MAKREEIRMIFSGGVMCEKLQFFHSPAVVRKGTFLHNFFSLNIDSDHRSVHLGWLIWVFLRMYGEKMINFPAQWHIKEFYNSNFLNFEFFVLNHSYGYLGVYFMAPRVHWQNAKEKINDFFLEVSCVKNYHFFTAPRWSEKALFCTIFFSLNIDSDHRSVHLGWFIWVFWEFMMEKW